MSVQEGFVQLPPDSTGKKLRTRYRTINSQEVHEQGVFQTAAPTYYALANDVTFATNKHHFTMFNASGSGITIAVRKIFAINVQTSTVTGVAIRMNVNRTTAAHTGGTAITAAPADTSNASIPAQVTIATGATATAGTLLWPIGLANDELGATQAFPGSTLLSLISQVPEGPEIQELRLREGQGFTIQQITASTVGLHAWLVVFTTHTDL